MAPQTKKPKPKQRTPKRSLPNKPMVQKTNFQVGDTVYARYHGDDVLKIIGIAEVDCPTPHYICEVEGKQYIISKFHLSTKKLASEIEDGNRRQLSISI